MRVMLMALAASGCLAQAANAQTHCSSVAKSACGSKARVGSVYCDQARRVSGLEWSSRAIQGGQDMPNRRLHRNPGPGYYGAAEGDCSVIYVRVGFEVAAIDPWTRIDRGLAPAHFEQARQRWLKDNGYVGSARTFTNPATAAGEGQEVQGAKGLPQPRGVIQLRDGVRKQAPRFEVNAEQPVRIMTPHNSPASTQAWADRVNETSATVTELAIAQRQ